MTSRERILTAFRLGTPDRVPVSPFIQPGWLEKAGAWAEPVLEKTDVLLDVGMGGGDPVLGRAAEVESRQEGNDSIAIFHTPKGDLTRRSRRTEKTSAQVEFPLKTPADAEKFFSIPYDPPEPDISNFLEWKQRVGERGLVLAGCGDGVCVPAGWFSPEAFSLCWADAPEVLIELTRVGHERLLRFVEKATAMGVDAWRIVGGEYVTVQLGPSAFEPLLTRFDTELVAAIHRGGGIAYYHNHGPVMRYLDDLAALGIDALDPVEVPPCGDVDLRLAKQRLRGKVCMVGPLDDMMVLSQVSEEEACRLARACLDAAGPDGYVLGGTASGLFTEGMARNFIAMAEMVERS